MEILWTGLWAFFRGDFSLTGKTSLWMFPIYGMAILLEPIIVLLSGLPLMVRGVVYMLLIFGVEFIWGWSLLNFGGIRAWDYSSSKYNLYGIIRLDYAPVWFIVGLFFEWIFKNILLFL